MTTCPAPSDPPSTSGTSLQNWAGTLSFTPGTIFTPNTRADIVRVIQEAEASQKSVKVMGSRWSFTPVFEAGDVVIDPSQVSGLCDTRILSGLTFRQPQLASAVTLVRGGTKVYNVNRLLHGAQEVSPGVDPYPDSLTIDPTALQSLHALPTMGGSGGQSLAGALATGSHGGDVHLPPLADFVHAIHLIGPGGQEFWIERGQNSLTVGDTQATLRALAASVPADLCNGIVLIRDDDTFNAALVSVGRMGVVYSVAIETVAGFFLKETRRNDVVWENFSANLSAAALQGYTRDKRFVQVLITPYRAAAGHPCLVSERGDALQTPDVTPLQLPPPGSPVFQVICAIRDTATLVASLIAVVGLLLIIAVALGKIVGALAAAIASASAVPIVGWLLAAALTLVLVAVVAILIGVIAAIAAVAILIGAALAGPASSFREVLANVASLLYSLGLKDVFRRLMTGLFSSNYPVGTFEHLGFRIMDTYNYVGDDQCTKVDSMEVAFDATAGGSDRHLAYISDILALFDEFYDRSVPVVGLLAVRFTSKSAGLIAMSRFATTCHVELPLIRSFQGNAEFLARAQKAAISRGGVPHWGQLMWGYTMNETDPLHAPEIDRWRAVLSSLIAQGAGPPFTFSNDFTQTYNLEPPDAGLPDNCGQGGPFPATTLQEIDGSFAPLIASGDITIKRIDQQAEVKMIKSLHGNITIQEKIDNQSSARLYACGSVTIHQKIDQGSYAFISAHGDITIGEKIDQGSSAQIESTQGGITIGQKVDQHSGSVSNPVSLTAATFVLIQQKVDQHSVVTISAGEDVTFNEGIDETSTVNVVKAQSVSIAKKIDQHSVVTIVASGDVTIGEAIDQHATVEITSLTGNITVQKVDGGAKAVLRALAGTVTIVEKIDSSASVSLTAPFSVPGGSAFTVI